MVAHACNPSAFRGQGRFIIWGQEFETSLANKAKPCLKQQNETKTKRYHYTPIKMAKIQNTENTKCWQVCGATETLIYCG